MPCANVRGTDQDRRPIPIDHWSVPRTRVQRYQFTGQSIDDTTLFYMNARYMDPQLGLFLSPDTLVPDPGNLFDYNRYMYTIGNPMRYNDPTGHDWKDVIATVVDFAQGVGAQVGYNNTVVALPSEINSFAPQSGESTSMQVGRFVGNVVTAVQGVAEISGGAGLGGAGIAACSTGVGCVATAPAVIGASAVIAHGATVATIGAVNAGTQLGNVVMAMVEGGSGRAQSNPATGRIDTEHSNFDNALGAAQQKAGDLGPNTQKMYDPETGTLIGERSADQLRGWRIDNDHVNFWNWANGKKGQGGIYGHEFFPSEQAGPHSKHIGYANWE